MRVFTIQPQAVWNILQKQGVFSCDRRRICDAGFKEAYQWYVEQAQDFIPGWKSSRPVWVWTKKPDMRSYRFIKDTRKPKYENHVIIELEVPDEKILLSDFTLWHYVLNKSYIPFNEKEALSFEKLCGEKLCFHELSKKLKARVKESWKRCLVTNPSHLQKFDSYVWGPEEWLQGIVEKLYLDQVVKVTPFKMTNTHSSLKQKQQA